MLEMSESPANAESSDDEVVFIGKSSWARETAMREKAWNVDSDSEWRLPGQPKPTPSLEPANALQQHPEGCGEQIADMQGHPSPIFGRHVPSPGSEVNHATSVEDSDSKLAQDYFDNGFQDVDRDALSLATHFATRPLGLSELSPIGAWDSQEHSDFDIVDRERQSLRRSRKRKGKGVLAGPPQVSDEELQEKLSSAWANDRAKKKERKIQREELRRKGLLGANHAQDESDNEGTGSSRFDLREKYRDGLTSHDLQTEIRQFLQSDEDSYDATPP